MLHILHNIHTSLHAQESVVFREGKRYGVAVEKLVVGDIVDVKFGDRIPADIRIVASAGFKVSLTYTHVLVLYCNGNATCVLAISHLM